MTKCKYQHGPTHSNKAREEERKKEEEREAQRDNRMESIFPFHRTFLVQKESLNSVSPKPCNYPWQSPECNQATQGQAWIWTFQRNHNWCATHLSPISLWEQDMNRLSKKHSNLVTFPIFSSKEHAGDENWWKKYLIIKEGGTFFFKCISKNRRHKGIRHKGFLCQTVLHFCVCNGELVMRNWAALNDSLYNLAGWWCSQRGEQEG